MNKKDYIKPAMETIMVEPQQLMGASTQPGFASSEADSSDPLGRGRRGSWGDLWDEE